MLDVQLSGSLRDAVGGAASVQIRAGTIRELLRKLVERGHAGRDHATGRDGLATLPVTLKLDGDLAGDHQPVHSRDRHVLDRRLHRIDRDLDPRVCGGISVRLRKPFGAPAGDGGILLGDVEAGVRHNFASNKAVASVQVAVPLQLFNRNQGNIYRANAELAAAHQEARRIELLLQDRLTDALNRYQVAKTRADRYAKDILPDLFIPGVRNAVAPDPSRDAPPAGSSRARFRLAR